MKIRLPAPQEKYSPFLIISVLESYHTYVSTDYAE